MRENELLWCTCCGKGVRNNAEENVAYGKVPYPYDDEYGECRECGGDDRVDGLDEESVKRRLGWSTVMFVEARFPVIRKGLSPANQEKFDAMPYWKKAAITLKMVERGVLLW